MAQGTGTYYHAHCYTPTVPLHYHAHLMLFHLHFLSAEILIAMPTVQLTHVCKCEDEMGPQGQQIAPPLSLNCTHISGSGRPPHPPVGSQPAGWNGPNQPSLPGAEVGGDGGDAGEGRNDTAHIGQEGEIVLVLHAHLCRGHLGGSKVASVCHLHTGVSLERDLCALLGSGPRSHPTEHIFLEGSVMSLHHHVHEAQRTPALVQPELHRGPPDTGFS
jgi:hypothetical protein